MMLKKDIDKILNEFVKPDPILARWDTFLEEKLEWLQEVVNDAKRNGFKVPTLPKTPSAAKRMRKRNRLSSVLEEEDVVIISPAYSQKRVTRNASKRVKHKLVTLEESPEPKIRKKQRSYKHLSVNLFDDSVMICSPVLPVVVKKEVVINEAGCQLENRRPVSPSFPSDSELIPSPNSTYVLKGGECYELDTAPPPMLILDSTFVIPGPGVTEKEKSVNCDLERESSKKLTVTEPLRHSQTSLTEQCNSTTREENNGMERLDIETIADIGNTRELETAVPEDNETSKPAECIVVHTPRSCFTTSAQSGKTLCVHLKRCDQKTPSSARRHATPVFSPCTSNSVKKRVAVYEKLQSVPEATGSNYMGGARMTRTKARAAAAAAALAACEQGDKKQLNQKKLKNKTEKLKKLAENAPKDVDNNQDGLGEPGKENSILISASRIAPQSVQKPNSRTPYTPHVLGEIHNFSSAKAMPLKPGVITTQVDTFIKKVPVKLTQDEEGKKIEEQKRREEKEMEAILKREEMLREKSEAQKKKREERMKKVLQARQAHEKEKEELQRLLLEEKNQRIEFIIREQEAKQKEQSSKKKLHMQQKIAEVEERRKLEEAARLAKLKEQEEEAQRIQALRKKENEEAEKQRQKRLAEEKEAALLREKTDQQSKAEAKAKDIPSKMKEQGENKFKTPKANRRLGKEEFTGVMLKNINDYGLDDVKSDDSSDDEENPKKVIPTWALKPHRFQPLELQAAVPEELLVAFMSCSRHSPDLTAIFTSLYRMKRTSSAVWSTPPQHRNQD